MTEDRLSRLLAEATDLTPSPALRARVAEIRPRSRLPFFVLSGATAALAAVALTMAPRTVSAAELIRRSDEAVRANLTYRAVNEFYVQGRWRPTSTTLSAPGWWLLRGDDGEFTLRTPQGTYRRFDAGGSVLLNRNADGEPIPGMRQNDPSPENYVRFLQGLARLANPKIKALPSGPPLVLGSIREEGGRRLREVTVSGGDERASFLIDERTNLPAVRELRRRTSGVWRPYARSRYVFPGASAGSEAFTGVLRGAPAIEVASLSKTWERRLGKVLTTLRPTEGAPLELRDARTLPNGDVLVLYTGPRRVSARLQGPHGEPFATCSFEPNNGYERPRSAPPLRPGGKELRGLRFVPLHADRPVPGPYRLRLYARQGYVIPNGFRPVGAMPPAPKERLLGDFPLDAPLQAADVPPWADATDGHWFGRRGEPMREGARLATLADTWLDGGGRSFLGAYGRDALNGWFELANVDPGPPERAVRHDPRAASEAIVVLRRLVEEKASRGVEDPLNAPLLAKLARWAKG